MLEPLDGHSVLGNLSIDERNEYYSLLGENLVPEENEVVLMSPWDEYKHLYEATEAVIAYIDDDHQLQHASAIRPQGDMINQFIDVTLDRFYVHRYPGSKKHKIQLNFSLEHLVNLAPSTDDSPLAKQDILYGYIVDAVDGQATPPTGAAIFRRLRIGTELRMTVATIHLADRTAEQIGEALESDVMKKGLILLATANPAFPMVSQMIGGATRLFLSSRRNKPVHEIPLGLLVNAATADPKLREGTYVLIQGKSDWVQLEKYYWNERRGRVEHRTRGEELAFNHMVFSIKKSLD